ncbi:MAG TPA: antibiotic biosynthesis monooxygenase [Burkholderiales bacterium]
MAAFNVVRFRVRPGSEQQFIEAHRMADPGFEGFLGGHLVRTGDQDFCMIGEWRDFQSIVDARPLMISFLDQVRHLLEDLGGGLGVTDPVSGEVAVRLRPPKAAKTARPTGKRRPAKRVAAKRAGARRASGKRGGKRRR